MPREIQGFTPEMQEENALAQRWRRLLAKQGQSKQLIRFIETIQKNDVSKGLRLAVTGASSSTEQPAIATDPTAPGLCPEAVGSGAAPSRASSSADPLAP